MHIDDADYYCVEEELVRTISLFNNIHSLEEAYSEM